MPTNLNIKYKEREINISADNEHTIKWLKEQLESQTRIPLLQQ